jgi:proline iminopeptidase
VSDPVEPYESGLLPVGDGHEVYYERFGRRGATPAVYCHGGPGSGASVGQRNFFDPELFDAVIFDQRGSGRSRPLASEPDADLSANTTAHLVADMELIRERCGFDRWLVVGMSWGSTLALAYAQSHRDRVSGVLCALVTTTSRDDVDWITRAVGHIYPEAYDRFTSFVPARLRHLPTVAAYNELLFDRDAEVAAAAAREWCEWEQAHVSLAPGHRRSPRMDDPEFALRFARLVTHYWRHAAFLEDDQLVRDAPTLAGVPGVLIHGRFDVSSPLMTPWRLHRAWPGSEFVVLAESGHGDGADFVPAVNRALGQLEERARLAE